jgi:hypothetical protein
MVVMVSVFNVGTSSAGVCDPSTLDMRLSKVMGRCALSTRHLRIFRGSARQALFLMQGQPLSLFFRDSLVLALAGKVPLARK